jgi:hypothetical protein
MCLAFLGAAGLLAGGAYSVYAHNARASGARLPTPSIVSAPAKQTSLNKAKFRYTDSGGPSVSFQCSLDRVPFKACALHPGLPGPVGRGKHVYRGLSLGAHSFRVRVIGSAGPPSRAAHYNWLVVAPANSTELGSPRPGAQPNPRQPGPAEPHPTPPSPEGFSISVGEDAIEPLYPGAPPQTIPLTLANPGDLAIFVTSVTVAVSGGPLGCPSTGNISVVQSNLSSAAPVEVAAHGSVTLPAQGRSAPTIQLLNLPVNQDACQNARFPLNLTGTSHT